MFNANVKYLFSPVGRRFEHKQLALAIYDHVSKSFV